MSVLPPRIGKEWCRRRWCWEERDQPPRSGKRGSSTVAVGERKARPPRARGCPQTAVGKRNGEEEREWEARATQQVGGMAKRKARWRGYGM